MRYTSRKVSELSEPTKLMGYKIQKPHGFLLKTGRLKRPWKSVHDGTSLHVPTNTPINCVNPIPENQYNLHMLQ